MSLAPDAAPLLVFVHGEDDQDQVTEKVTGAMPDGPECVVLSLPRSDAELRARVDELAPEGRLVFLVGHGAAVPVVGELVLAGPARFAGAGLLKGTLRLDDPPPAATLAGLPVFWAEGERDTVSPADQITNTRNYLQGVSGAAVVTHVDIGDHLLSTTTLGELGKWLGHRLEHIEAHGVAPVGPARAVEWPGIGELPERAGGRPLVTWSVPQQQISDQAIIDYQDRLFERVSALDGVQVVDSDFAVPGARALTVSDAKGPARAFLDEASGEFAHLHPWYDGSVHLALTADQAADAIAKGWAQPHMWAGTRFSDGFLLVYGPRDDAEVGIVAALVEASYRFAATAP